MTLLRIGPVDGVWPWPMQLVLAVGALGLLGQGCTSSDPASGGGGGDGGTAGSGGSDGGSDSGTGGSDSGTGGSDTGTGGSDSGTGGSDSGTGGNDNEGPRTSLVLEFNSPRMIYRMPPDFASSEGLDEPTWSLSGGDGTLFANLVTGAVHNAVDFYSPGAAFSTLGAIGTNVAGEDVPVGWLYSYGQGRVRNGFGDPYPPALFTFGITAIDTTSPTLVDAFGVQDPNDPEITLGVVWTGDEGYVRLASPPNFVGSFVAVSNDLASPATSASAHFDSATMVIEIVTAAGSLATAIDDGGFDVTEQEGFMSSGNQIRCIQEGYCAATDPDGNVGVLIDATDSGVPPSILGQVSVPGAFGARIVDAGAYVVACFTGSDMVATGDKFACLTLDKNDLESPPVASSLDVSDLCEQPTFLESVQTAPDFIWAVACLADDRFVYVLDFPQLP